MLKYKLRTILFCLLASAPVAADELLDAAEAMCEKVKSCAIERMEKENMPAAQRQRAQPALDALCESVKEEVKEVVAGHPQYANALDCMRSMLGLNCTQIQDEEQAATPVCVAFEKQMDDESATQTPATRR